MCGITDIAPKKYVKQVLCIQKYYLQVYPKLLMICSQTQRALCKMLSSVLCLSKFMSSGRSIEERQEDKWQMGTLGGSLGTDSLYTFSFENEKLPINQVCIGIIIGSFYSISMGAWLTSLFHYAAHNHELGVQEWPRCTIIRSFNNRISLSIKKKIYIYGIRELGFKFLKFRN